MRIRASVWLLCALAGLLLLLPVGGAAQSSQTVPSIELSGTIDPATESWIGSELERAEVTSAFWRLNRTYHARVFESESDAERWLLSEFARGEGAN